MVAIKQYIHATGNAFISDAIRFVARMFVCATARAPKPRCQVHMKKQSEHHSATSHFDRRGATYDRDEAFA
jgi:hypothetical protein